jgi:hypothetical protein
LPKHSLGPGKSVIDGLVHLGEALGYVSRTEFAVLSDASNPPAVDVAWLREENQRFPLMIFEVETRAGSSVANNALKVFAQETNQFEKPLFFFHVFLSGKHSSRLKALRVQYGTHNYRHYSLDAGEFTKLIIDILNQHRRVSPIIDVEALIEVLHSDPWQAVECSEVLQAIESADFAVPYTSVYAGLCLSEDWVRPHLLRRLALDPWEGDYGTYLGAYWRVPIHLALLANLQPAQGAARLQELIDWQERSSYMTQIGPHFGLSRDYDFFILGLAPTLWALIAALMRAVPGASPYIVKQNQAVLEALSNANFPFAALTAVWLLHLAHAGDNLESFEVARQYINQRGGVNRTLLLNPPGYVDLEEPFDSPWLDRLQDHAEPVDDLSSFRATISREDWPAVDLVHLALRMLLVERDLELAGPLLLAGLNEPLSEKARVRARPSREAGGTPT